MNFLCGFEECLTLKAEKALGTKVVPCDFCTVSGNLPRLLLCDSLLVLVALHFSLAQQAEPRPLFATVFLNGKQITSVFLLTVTRHQQL